MKKTWKSRLVSGMLTAVFAASLLPVTAFATEPVAVAQVGDTTYTTLLEAVAEAAKLTETEQKVVILLADVAAKDVDDPKTPDVAETTLALGDVALLVPADGEANDTADKLITIDGITITGNRGDYVVKNEGHLTLNNVTISNANTTSGMAVYNAAPEALPAENMEQPEDAQLSIVSGSYSGAYAVGTKNGVVGLNQLRTAEKPDLAGAPVMKDAKIAAFYVDEGGLLEVCTDLGDVNYTVEAAKPGPVACMSEAASAVKVKPAWFVPRNGETHASTMTDKVWTMAAIMTGDAVALNPASVTFDGKEHLPEVTYNGTVLVKDTDYTVTATPEQVKNAGEYTIKITGQGVYTGNIEKKFIIEAAAVEPVLTVTTPEGGFKATGSALEPAVSVKVGDTEIPAGEYTVSYENNTAVGTATVTVTDKDGGNYSFAALTKTFEIGEAAPAELVITGQPSAVTYGDAPIQLGTTGGGEGTVTWEVVKGTAAIDATGKLTITGAGDVSVKATKGEASAQWDVKVQPATLTIGTVTGADKVYDKKDTVSITKVELVGVLNSDDVKISTEGLTGKLNAAGVGEYDKVTLGNLSLTGTAVGNYTFTAPTDPVTINKIQVTKADLSAALDSIEVKLSVSDTKVEVPNLGAGMPEDAGTLVFHNHHQGTNSGSKVIVLDWDVDESGKLTSEIASATGGDVITYTVVIASDNYENAELKVVVSLGATAVDASKVTVTPEKTSLTYNGADQKPAVTVKYDGSTLTAEDYEVSYPSDVKNVGDKEIKITFKGKYSGTATGKYTITKAKVTVSGGSVADKTYDGGTGATINVGTLSGVVKGDDVKVTGKGLFADKNSGTGKKVAVTYSLSGKAAGNYELTNPNVTLSGRIYAISANSLYNSLGSLSTANASSAKKQTLQNVVTRANLALSDGALAGSERTSITAAKSDAEAMLERIDSAATAANTESIRATAKVTKDNVKLTDQAALQKAQSDLNTAITTYSGNYTEGENKQLQTDKTRVADALAVVTKVDSAQKLIQALPTDYTTVTTVTVDAVKAADNAYNGLSNYGKSLIAEAETKKLTAAVEAIDGVTPTEVPEETMKPTINGVGQKDPAPETIKFPTWIILIAVVLAAAAGGGYFWWYKKQQEEEEEYYY